jgi:hypothetical protein
MQFSERYRKLVTLLPIRKSRFVANEKTDIPKKHQGSTMLYLCMLYLCYQFPDNRLFRQPGQVFLPD